MTGKKVRVFWPVDSQWYIADVQQYDAKTGEHLLRYPDGDTEWVRIGEDHTTNAQYREYFKNHGDGAAPHTEGLARLPSLGNGVSFALSAMSQSFGMPTSAEDEKAMRLKTPSQQQRLFQQLNLDRTASSMSSFGMFGGIGGRQPSFGQPGAGRAQPFQMLSPNYTHSFSSKFGPVPSMDYGPHVAHADGKAGNGPPPLPYAHAPPHPQQREEGSANIGHRSPGTRDEPDGMVHSGHHPWIPNQYSNPNYYDGQAMYGYPASQQHSSDAAYGAKPKHKGSSSKLSKSSKRDDPKSKKALAKAWTKAEDEYLLDLVLQMKHPLKWSIIAQNLSDAEVGDDDTPIRTGKQCRERYVNHLNPRLKHTDFTPAEDATIWRLYATIGTQWAKMSKVIPGRTDNNLKNRFDNLKRQLIREEESRSRAPILDDHEQLVHAEKVREVPEFLRTRIEDMWKHQQHIGLIAANTSREARDDVSVSKVDDKGNGVTLAADMQKLRKFGPFEVVKEPLQCGRCGLFMPSAQCGNEMCTKTKWCRVCTKVPMHMGGSVLRECLNLRKTQDKELATGGVGKLLTAV